MISQSPYITKLHIFNSVYLLKVDETVECYIFVQSMCPVIEGEQVTAVSTHTGSYGDICVVHQKSSRFYLCNQS